jgi:hypothetical protein
MELSNAHYRTSLNAIPMPAFVVDSDVQILDMNQAAAGFCDQKREAAYKRRGGEIFHCLHSTDVPEGCGRGPFCKNCVIRNSVTKCLEGQTISRKVMKLQLAYKYETKDMQVLITASPIPDGDKKLAMVMVEDITDRQKPVYNISPTTPLRSSLVLRQEIEWQPRPRTLKEFPEEIHARLRQLDFNRTITVCVGDKAMYVRRVRLNQFLCCHA